MIQCNINEKIVTICANNTLSLADLHHVFALDYVIVGDIIDYAIKEQLIADSDDTNFKILNPIKLKENLNGRIKLFEIIKNS